MNIKAQFLCSSSIITLRFSYIWNWITTRGGVYLSVGFSLIVGAIFRLHRLGRDSFWLDEIDEITVSSLDFPRLLSALSVHASPPLDYLMMHFVTKLGNDETLIRLPAAILSIITICLIFFAGKNLFSQSVGISASIMFAFSLPSIAYAQEARMYSLAIALTTLMLITLSMLVQQPRNSYFWILSIFSAILLIYTHYYGLLILFSVGLLWIFVLIISPERKFFLIPGLLGLIIIALTYSLWLPSMITQSSIRGGSLQYVLNHEDYWNTILVFLSGGISVFFRFLLLMLFSLGIVVCISRKPIVAGIALAFTLVPLLIAYLVPQLSVTATPRNFLVLLPGILISSSIGLVVIIRFFLNNFPQIGNKNKYPASFTIILITLFISTWPSRGILRNFYQTGFWSLKEDRADWRQTSDYLINNMQSGDLILVNDRYTRYLLTFYLDPIAIEQVTLNDFINNSDQITSGLNRYIPVITLEANPSLLRKEIGNYNRIWAVFPDYKVLSEIGIKSENIERIDADFNVPISLIKPDELPGNLIISPLDSWYAFTEGWSSKVYSIDNQIVRTMSGTSSITIPVWSEDHEQLILTYFVSPGAEGSNLILSTKEVVLGEFPLTSGWQTTVLNIPRALLINEDRIMVNLMVNGLLDSDMFWEIGETGEKSPISITAESSGVEHQSYADIYLDGKIYSWYLDGRGYGRGYTLIAIDPTTAEVIGYEVFDTHDDETASDRMFAFIDNLQPKTIVAGAVKDDGGTKLTDIGYQSLQMLGIQTDVRGHFRAAHAFIGIKGTIPGTALEDGLGLTARVIVGKDVFPPLLALARLELNSTK